MKDIFRTVVGLSSLGLKFDAKYNDLPGWFYYVLQSIALQGISVHEISSTYTELILYVDKKDIKLAFDTIQNLFSKEKDSLRNLKSLDPGSEAEMTK